MEFITRTNNSQNNSRNFQSFRNSQNKLSIASFPFVSSLISNHFHNMSTSNYSGLSQGFWGDIDRNKAVPPVSRTEHCPTHTNGMHKEYSLEKAIAVARETRAAGRLVNIIVRGGKHANAKWYLKYCPREKIREKLDHQRRVRRSQVKNYTMWIMYWDGDFRSLE